MASAFETSLTGLKDEIVATVGDALPIVGLALVPFIGLGLLFRVGGKLGARR